MIVHDLVAHRVFAVDEVGERETCQTCLCIQTVSKYISERRMVETPPNHYASLLEIKLCPSLASSAWNSGNAPGS